MRELSRLWLLLVLAPFAAAAQIAPITNTPVPLSKALIFPNYDNVLVGKDEALEGGAYIARVGDAAANFYNPAGLVRSEGASLNASSAGYVYTELTSKVSGASISSSKLDNVPGYIGSVSQMPFVDLRNLRVGLSITRADSWSPGGIDQTLDARSQGFTRLNYSSSANFQSQLYQAAAGFSPVLDRSLRLGLGVGLAQTSYGNTNTVSGTQTSTGQPAQFLETIRAGGTDSALVFTFGAQWDVIAGLTVGATFRPPGLELWNSSLVTSESSNIGATASTAQYYRDDTGIFRYKQPLTAGIGAAYRFLQFEVEADLRYHNAVSQYDFYRGKVPYQFSDSNNTATTAPPPLVRYSAKRVFNGAIGGKAYVGRRTTVHLGFNTALSPVADPVTSPLREADLYAFSGGVDFQLAHFGASLGASYQFGTSPALTSSPGNLTILQEEVLLRSFSLFYAISYNF
ncbi:MAG TPA: hypothetical protein VFE90_12220 [Myxococcales bacterium]|nr:hypothetical protein [Myxococcales bacterium]